MISIKIVSEDHPHLQVIVNEDSLSSNAPHIKDLEQHNCHYILGVKEGDHKFLFQHVDQAVEEGRAVEQILMQTLYQRPVVTVKMVKTVLNVQTNTASALIQDFVKHGIVEEMTGYKRNRIFIFSTYVRIFD